jgi:hypothetical protein
MISVDKKNKFINNKFLMVFITEFWDGKFVMKVTSQFSLAKIFGYKG